MFHIFHSATFLLPSVLVHADVGSLLIDSGTVYQWDTYGVFGALREKWPGNIQ